ncbi:MAG: hypothetical protein PHU94_00345 [Bacilli bacterium]|nr:hypothetical protein [Bacilli bacterium]MDD4733545.1 hypothetical protein [Bacilli bacterium]
MKKWKQLILVGLLMIQTFSFIPLSTSALSKSELLEDYVEIRDKADLTMDNILNFLTTYDDELSDVITIELAGHLIDDFVARDVAAFIDHVISVFEVDSQLAIDLNALKPEAVVLKDDIIQYKEDALEFINSDENITASDLTSTVEDSIDSGLKALQIIDKLVEIFNNSTLGDVDIEAIINSEFEEVITKIRNNMNTIIAEQEISLINHLDSIRDDLILNDEQKFDRIIDIIVLLEEVEARMHNTFIRMDAVVSTDLVTNYLTKISAFSSREMNNIIILVKKYLIDEMTVSMLDENYGSSEYVNNIIVPVYGVVVDPNPVIRLQPSHLYLIGQRPISDLNDVEDNLYTNSGSMRYSDLISGRVGTGSMMHVNNGNEDVLSYTFIIKGDLLGRALSDITDIFRLIDGVLGTNNLTGIYQTAGDMNDDLNNDISDVFQLIDQVLGR